MPRSKIAATVPAWLAELANTSKSETVGVRELATGLGVCEATVSRWIKTGRLAAPKVGHQRRITKAAVEKLLATA
jgi:excisionase family DNA binding protein